jgi:hypothetical protein
MKKVLLLAVCLFLTNSYLNSGNTSSKDNQTSSSQTKHYSVTGKNQFLRAPQTAPVLLPLPNSNNPPDNSSGLSSQSANPDLSKPQNNFALPSPASSQSTQPQEINPPPCTPDATSTCPVTTTTTDQSTCSTTSQTNNATNPPSAAQKPSC